MPAMMSALSRQDSLSEDEEAILVESIQRDPGKAASAFASLYRHYLPPVYYYLLSKVGNRNEAEDLASQVFLDVLEGLKDYRHQGHFAAWLFTIARNRAVDHYRRNPELSLEHAHDVADPMLDPLLQIAHREDLVGLARLVSGLGQEEKELLRLRFAAGLHFGEIAKLLKRKESAVKMAYYRLLARMQKHLEADNHE
jgi:RNA polymerase sigma-70 factor (ECF subfamily)